MTYDVAHYQINNPYSEGIFG